MTLTRSRREWIGTGLHIRDELHGLVEIAFAFILMAMSYLAGLNLSAGQYFPALLALGELLGTVVVLEKEARRIERR
jgi:hypothetical protein